MSGGEEARAGARAAAGIGRRPALATLSAVLFLTFLDTTIVSVALADIQTSLHAGVSELQWVVNGYALTFAALMLGMGMLGDRLGRRKVMLAGLAVFVGGSIAGAVAPSISILVASRVVMGVGAAACEPGTLSILRHLYPERARRARALGVWAAVAGLALAMGPVIGGVLVGLAGWRLVFWFNIAAGLAVLLAARNTIPESADPQPGRLDLAGLTLGPIALGTAIYAVIHGETTGYANAAVLALFAVSAVAAVFFVLAERRSPDPVFDLRFLRRKPFTGSLLIVFAAYFSLFAIFFFTALYLQVVTGYSAFRTAALFLPMAVAMIAASALTGRWVARAGPRLPAMLGCLVAGVGILATDLALRGQVDFAMLAVSLALAGLGCGVTIVPVTSVALGEIPAEHSGMAAGATTTSRELGAVVGVAVLGSLVNGHLTVDLTRRLTQLGVPSGFRGIVINAVETGQVPKGGGAAAAAQQAFGPIVAHVIEAAYGAFRAGLSVSLLIAGIVMLVSAAIAWRTLAPSGRGQAAHEEWPLDRAA